MAYVDGYHTLEQISWPVPVRLEVRRWYADASITQLCFNCGWLQPSQDVKILETQMRQTIEAFKVSPAYAKFKKLNGNMVLYSAKAEKLQPTEDFIAQCRVVVAAEYPNWTEVKEWRYGTNDDGWTILLKRKETT